MKQQWLPTACNGLKVYRIFVIGQTRLLSTVFLCNEFKLENIYFGINFCGKNVCGNFYLRELIFADRWKNRKNYNPQKFRATRYTTFVIASQADVLRARHAWTSAWEATFSFVFAGTLSHDFVMLPSIQPVFTGREDMPVAFDFSQQGHALVTLYVQFLCSAWSKFDRWVHAENLCSILKLVYFDS